ncbi:hypothetical protein K402DRAFT_340512 [Aulographum hederae CBS 113979]|uniref:Complex 1 LYR protein domain-containing protein n=1 Tax=Aulographum hederae CBS 113979 TaxID=1176131 RepID=A0A6G1GN26_9PEZI|nr:hypothetical protein K402DRAFT_340512 [Aulographum hederae CBS 113979]
MPRLSGLQRNVVSLYRQCLRACGKKPIETRDNFRRFVRNQFRENAAGIDKKDFAAIEYMIRKGQRQLEIYKDEGIRNVV